MLLSLTRSSLFQFYSLYEIFTNKRSLSASCDGEEATCCSIKCINRCKYVLNINEKQQQQQQPQQRECMVWYYIKIVTVQNISKLVPNIF
jgi:hypothetical protein